MAADRPGDTETSRPSTWRRFLWVAVVAIVVNMIVVSILSKDDGRVTVPYSVFTEQVESDNVASVSARGQTISGVFRQAIDDPSGTTSRVSKFRTERPVFATDDPLT